MAPLSPQFGEQQEFDLGHLQQEAHQTPPIPQEHYNQPSGNQMVFPGMEMTPQQHAGALGAGLGEGYSADLQHDDWFGHQLNVRHSESRFEPPRIVGRLSWRPEQDTPHWKSGEITWVGVDEEHRGKGIATKMVDTGTRMAEEHPEISAPRNSDARSDAGMGFSHDYQHKRGAPVL